MNKDIGLGISGYYKDNGQFEFVSISLVNNPVNKDCVLKKEQVEELLGFHSESFQEILTKIENDWVNGTLEQDAKPSE